MFRLTVLHPVNPAVDIVSCQPEASAVMTESIKAGRILDLPSEPTLSDGTAGGIEPGAIPPISAWWPRLAVKKIKSYQD